MKPLSIFVAFFVSLAGASLAEAKKPDISFQLFELCKQRANNQTVLLKLLQEAGWQSIELDIEGIGNLEVSMTSPEGLALLYGFVQNRVGDEEDARNIEWELEEFASRGGDRIVPGFLSDRYEVFTNGDALFSFEFYPEDTPVSVQCHYSGNSDIQPDVDHPEAVRSFEGKNIAHYSIHDGKGLESVYRIDGAYASELFQSDLGSMVFFTIRGRFN